MTEVDIHLENKTKSRYFFAFLMVMYSVSYMTKNCFGIAMASIVKEGIFTKSQTGLITAVFYLVYSPLQVFGGIISDRYSPERLLEYGLIGTIAVNIILFFNHNYYVILAVWAVNAVIQTPFWPATFKIVSSQLVRSDRKNMIFLTSFTNSFGLIMGYVVAAVITSWQYIFLVSATMLTICLIVLHVFCKKLNFYMKPDKKESKKKEGISAKNVSTFRLFLESGFFVVSFCFLLRTMVEFGVKTLSPTMLMESYKSISPSVGNLINVLIIASGIVGAILIKFEMYPRIIRNEVTGIFVTFLGALPFAFVLRFIGIIPSGFSVIAMCGISAALTGANLFTSYFMLRFSRYGKSGTVAGISNAAGCFGIMFQSYGFVHIAEKYSWGIVAIIWVFILLVSLILTAIIVPRAKRFANKK